MDIGELLVAIGVSNTRLTAGLAKSKAELSGFANETKAQSAASSAALNSVGFAAAGIAVAVGAIAVGATSAANRFQASMELIRTQAGGTQAEVDAMTAGVLAMAPAVGFGPEALAAGLYHVESAGLRGARALDVLRTAAEGAKVGNADLESVTNALIAEVNSGIGGVKGMGDAMGVLNAIVGAGNMRMADLAGAMSTGILSTAKTFGISIQSVGAALADMTNQGIPAQDAATRLRMTISLLGAPTSKAAEQLASIGISSRQLADDMRRGGIYGALTDLSAHLKKSGLDATEQAALLSNAFGGGRSSSAIMTLLGSLKQLGAIQTQVTAGAGAFGDAWAATQEEAAMKGEKLRASFDSIMTAVGQGLLPAVSSILDRILPVVTAIAQWTAANPKLASTILLAVGAIAALVAGVIFLGPILGALGGIIGGLGALLGLIASPIVLVVGAIVALAAAFGLLGQGPQDAVNGVLATIQNALPGIISAASNMATAFVAWVSDVAPKVVARLQVVVNKITWWIATQGPSLVAQLRKWADAFIAWISPMIPKAINALAQLAGQLASWIGSQVPGWVAQLMSWAQAFVDWIGQVLPPLLGRLGELAGQLLGWIAAQLPVLAAQILVWADAFIAWIAPLIPKLLAAIPPVLAALAQLAVQVVGWIASQVPVVAGALARVALQFVAWVLPKIPELLGKLAEFGVNLVGWIIGELPVIAMQLLAWGGAFIGWVIDSIPGLLANLAKWLGEVVAWFGGAVHQVQDGAFRIGKAIFDGILSGIGNIAKAVGDKLNEIPGVSIVGGAISFGGSVVSNAIGGVAQLGSNVVNTVTGGSGGSGGGHPAGNPNAYGLGGIVPGFGPQLAIVHGGETILPPDYLGMALSSPGLPSMGRSSGGGGSGGMGGEDRLAAALHRFSAALEKAAGGVPLTLDGQSIGDMVDRRLYNSRSIYQPLGPSTGSAR